MTALQRRLLDLLQVGGWNTTAFQTLEQPFQRWFSADGQGVVAYGEALGTWVVAGAPICPPARLASCLAEFLAHAEAHSRQVCLLGVARRPGLDAAGGEWVKIGEQPWWNPQRWDETERRQVAAQTRRAARLGVRIRTVPGDVMADPATPERRAAETVIGDWRRSRLIAELGFLVHLDPFILPEAHRYLLAETEDGIPVGLLSAIPVYGRNGWFFEDVLRRPGAPNGTVEALIDGATRTVATEGADFVTLGLAPLRGVQEGSAPGWLGGLFRFSWRRLDRLYRFQGVSRFKAKFNPDGWEAQYLVGFPRVTPRTVAATLLVFARTEPLAFALATGRRLARHGAEAVPPTGWRWTADAFALTLVGWTVVLARSDGDHWFDRRWMRDAWVAFDVAMIGVFALLGHGAERGASWLLPAAQIARAAVATDLALTAVHGIRLHQRGHRGRRDRWASLVALSGPALATLFLTGLVHAAHRLSRR